MCLWHLQDAGLHPDEVLAMGRGRNDMQLTAWQGGDTLAVVRTYFIIIHANNYEIGSS